MYCTGNVIKVRKMCIKKNLHFIYTKKPTSKLFVILHISIKITVYWAII